MCILAIESACRGCSVALMRDGNIIAYVRDDQPSRQAAQLVPMIERIMRDAQCSFSDLARIAVSVGPGSFTGIRIGLATACGIGFAANVPVVGISTLAAMAAAVESDCASVLAVLEAGKGEVYVQAFDSAPKLRAVGEAKVMSPDAMQALAHERDAVTRELPDAQGVAWLAAHGEDALLLPPEPLYIRPPDAKPATKSGLI